MQTYYNPMAEQGMTSGELGMNDDEKNFIKILSDELTNILNISFPDREIVKNLIQTSLINRNFKMLLLQYYNKKLEITANTMKRMFDVPKDVNINYDNAVHAKLNDILDYIKTDGKSYNPPTDETPTEK